MMNDSSFDVWIDLSVFESINVVKKVNLTKVNLI